VATSINEFVNVLIEAVVIVSAVGFISLGSHKRPASPEFSGQPLPLRKRRYIDICPGQNLVRLGHHRAGFTGRQRHHRG